MLFFQKSPKNPIIKFVKFYFLMTAHFRTMSARDVTAAIFFEKKFYCIDPPYHVVQTKNLCGHTGHFYQGKCLLPWCVANWETSGKN